MASVAVTNITNISRAVTGLKGNALNIGGLPVEVFRIASGQLPGDTAVLVPATFSKITAVVGMCTDNLPTTGVGATNVTVTLGNANATPSATVGAATVVLIGPVPTS